MISQKKAKWEKHFKCKRINCFVDQLCLFLFFPHTDKDKSCQFGNFKMDSSIQNGFEGWMFVCIIENSLIECLKMAVNRLETQNGFEITIKLQQTT